MPARRALCGYSGLGRFKYTRGNGLGLASALSITGCLWGVDTDTLGLPFFSSNQTNKTPLLAMGMHDFESMAGRKRHRFKTSLIALMYFSLPSIGENTGASSDPVAFTEPLIRISTGNTSETSVLGLSGANSYGLRWSFARKNTACFSAAIPASHRSIK